MAKRNGNGGNKTGSNHGNNNCRPGTANNSNNHRGNQNNNSNRGGKPPYPRDKDGDIEKLNDSFGNDATTYFPNVKMAEDNVKFSPEVVLQARYPITDQVYYTNVFSIGFNPSVGVSKYDAIHRVGYTSPIALAAKKFFTAICAFTGRIPSYGPQDIMILVAALESFIEVTEWGRRAFGSVFKFDMLNRDIPRRIIESMGIDYDDFVDKRETYLPQWNSIINSADQITVPDDIPIFGKSLKMYQNIYRENDTELSAFYVLNPSSAWYLNEVGSDQGSTLDTIPWCDDYTHSTYSTGYATEPNYGEAYRPAHPIRKFSYYVAQYSKMVTALLDSSTMNLIYSDIIKYASKVGGFALWKPDIVYDDYRTPVVYESGFNKLLHNFTLVGIPTGPKWQLNDGTITMTKDNDVMPDINTNGLVYNPGFFQASDSLFCYDTARANDTQAAKLVNYVDNVVDYDTSDPDINYKVDTIAYKATCDVDPYTATTVPDMIRWRLVGKANWDLPDHYVASIHTYAPMYTVRDKTDLVSDVGYNDVYNNGWWPCDWTGTLLVSNAAVVAGMSPYMFVYGKPGAAPGISVYPWEPIDNHPVFWQHAGSQVGGTWGNTSVYTRGYSVRGDLDNFMFITGRKLRDIFRLTYQHMYMATHLDRDI